MSRKKLFFVIIPLLLLGGILLLSFFYLSNSNGGRSIFGGGEFPVGTSSGDTTDPTSSNPQTGEGDPTSTDPNTPIGQMYQITAEPVAGSIVIQSASTTLVRYVERATGHVFEARVDSRAQSRLSNTTIPKIYEAVWLPDGSSVFLRYLNKADVVKTFYAKLKASSGTSTIEMSPYSLDGNFLPDGISTLSVSNTGSKIFYLGAIESGVVGNTADPDGSKKVQVFSSPLIHWQSIWSGDDSILLTSNAAASIPGVSFLLSNISKKVVSQKILANIYGLTTSVNLSGESVLYSEVKSENLSLKALSPKEKSQVIRTLSSKTLPEKCVWSKKEKTVLFCAVPQSIPEGEHPDLWYQGVTSFFDSFWRIDTVTGKTDLIYYAKSNAEAYDAIKLQLSVEEDYVIFTNNKDNSLWSLRVAQ